MLALVPRLAYLDGRHLHPRLRSLPMLTCPLAGWVCGAAVLLGAEPPQPPAVDLVLVNGKIWTANPKQPEAQAMAVGRDRILAVGTNAEVRAVVGPRHRIFDLKGKRVVPGFHDSHV